MLRLKEIRLKNTYSLEDMAKITNISAGTILRYEKGERHVPEEVIRVYCDTFGVTPNQIYNIGELTKKPIPIHSAIINNKTCVGIAYNTGKININSEQRKKRYSFAMQIWNMEMSPKLFTGDMMYFVEDKKIVTGDVIAFIYKNIPYIRIYNEYKGKISLKTINRKSDTIYINSLDEIIYLGRLVEVNSFLRKGGNPWPNGR